MQAQPRYESYAIFTALMPVTLWHIFHHFGRIDLVIEAPKG